MKDQPHAVRDWREWRGSGDNLDLSGLHTYIKKTIEHALDQFVQDDEEDELPDTIGLGHTAGGGVGSGHAGGTYAGGAEQGGAVGGQFMSSAGGSGGAGLGAGSAGNGQGASGRPGGASGTGSAPGDTGLPFNLFEIIGCTIVRVLLPPGTDPGTIRVAVEHRDLSIQAGDRRQAVLLPVKAETGSSQAYLRGDLLEIRLPQDPRSRPAEIPIVQV